jgi:type 1 fimbria pilin
MSEGWRQKIERRANNTTSKHSILKNSNTIETTDGYQIQFEATTPVTNETVIFKIGETVYEQLEEEFAIQLQDGNKTELTVNHTPSKPSKTLIYTIIL